MSNLIQQVSNDTHVLSIYYDTDIESPREWENLGTFYTWSRDYHSPDEHSYVSPRDFLEWLAYGLSSTEIDTGGMDNTKLLRIIHKQAIILPVYRYSHGGVAYNTVGFNCRWDSGQVGYIYVTKENIRKAFNRKVINGKLRSQVEKQLRNEVEFYSKWANGEIYACDVKAMGSDKDAEPVFTYGCLYGTEWGTNGLKDELPKEYHDLLEKL